MPPSGPTLFANEELEGVPSFCGDGPDRVAVMETQALAVRRPENQSGCDVACFVRFFPADLVQTAPVAPAYPQADYTARFGCAGTALGDGKDMARKQPLEETIAGRKAIGNANPEQPISLRRKDDIFHVPASWDGNCDGARRNRLHMQVG